MNDSIHQTVKFSVPQKYRRGSLQADEARSVQSGVKLLDLIAAERSIAGCRLLDFGCGVKLAQALVERSSPQARYVGLDVYREMIDYMAAALADDERYEFRAVDFHNDMYNRDGERMDGRRGLGADLGEFDILTMFSVVTHMAPADAEATLRGLRHHAALDAVLIFSVFVDPDQAENFIDQDPNRPLLRAFYRTDYLEGIIEGAGWRIERSAAPIAGVIQRHYVCRPG